MIQKPQQATILGLAPLQILLIGLISFSGTMLLLVLHDILFIGLNSGFVMVLVGVLIALLVNMWVLCISVPISLGMFLGLQRKN